jgi:hypothetical protein
VRAPRRPVNPLLWRHVVRTGKQKSGLAVAAGYPFYTTFFDTLHAREVPATPLVVARLERLAEVVGFPKDEIFLDGGAR